jgi:hypothetical protein
MVFFFAFCHCYWHNVIQMHNGPYPGHHEYRQEDVMTNQCSEHSTKKILERKAKTARQQREASDFSCAEEHDNRRTLLYSYHPHNKR